MTNLYNNSIAIKKLPFILNKSKSILLVRGNDSYESCGAKDLFEPHLKNYNIIEVKDFYKNPDIKDIEKTIKIINENNIDFIIGIGGGTVMDVAKAASILHSETEPIEKFIKGEIKLKGNKIPRLLIPTTAGTGAETTPFAVVYIDKTKYSLAHPSMSPENIFLIPELTYSLSSKVTAQTGADALAQAIEGFWSFNSTEESRNHSEVALTYLLDCLKDAVNKPTVKSRKGMLSGSYLAGKSISVAKTTAAHAISYYFTAHYDVPHGQAVMFTLPYFFEIHGNATENNLQKGLDLKSFQTNFNKLLFLLDVKTGIEARDKLLDLMDEIGLERKLSSFGIVGNDLSNIVKSVNLERLKNNPIKITEEMIWKILREIL